MSFLKSKINERRRKRKEYYMYMERKRAIIILEKIPANDACLLSIRCSIESFQISASVLRCLSLFY